MNQIEEENRIKSGKRINQINHPNNYKLSNLNRVNKQPCHTIQNFESKLSNNGTSIIEVNNFIRNMKTTLFRICSTNFRFVWEPFFKLFENGSKRTCLLLWMTIVGLSFYESVPKMYEIQSEFVTKTAVNKTESRSKSKWNDLKSKFASYPT